MRSFIKNAWTKLTSKSQPNSTERTENTLRTHFKEYARAVIPLFTINSSDDEGVGSAFHVGEGVFVTARHVVEGKKSVTAAVDSGALPAALLKECDPSQDTHTSSVTPHYHRDPNIDVAVFKIPAYAFLPAIILGGHLDDWISDDQFVLNEVLVLGFPPIPLSRRPLLVASRGEVTGVVDLLAVKHVHFILSVMARGGFSGGVALSEWGVALGVITMSLVKNHLPEESGYLTVLSVEPIYECLAQHGLLTDQHRELFGDLFDDATTARRI